ncbi:hypothetical protein GLYMA_13G236851v4 [Glycine max]|nr:hypothetical protein GLYMA_13G236851v4 [Glycine max]KAH1103041.1 hypothetical protein GYH30_037175 [Glycine max]
MLICFLTFPSLMVSLLSQLGLATHSCLHIFLLVSSDRLPSTMLTLGGVFYFSYKLQRYSSFPFSVFWP